MGSGGYTAVHVFDDRFIRLTNVTLASGTPAVIDALLERPAQSFTMPSDIRTSSFAALGASVHPRARPGSAIINPQAIPHAVEGPDVPQLTTALGFLALPDEAPDHDFGPMAYGDFLDPLWKKWAQLGFSLTVTVAAPGAASSADIATGFHGAVPIAEVPNPFVPVISPPGSPTVDGMDATDDLASPVTLTPSIAWSPPSLGAPTHYMVAVNEVISHAGATEIAPVLVAQVYGTSFRVPPAFLATGHTYYAAIAATDAGPWDVLDGNYDAWLFPENDAERITGLFSPGNQASVHRPPRGP